MTVADLIGTPQALAPDLPVVYECAEEADHIPTEVVVALGGGLRLIANSHGSWIVPPPPRARPANLEPRPRV